MGWVRTFCFLTRNFFFLLTDNGTGTVLNDLFVFDIDTITWIELTTSVSGAPPLPRFSLGFTAAGGRLYLQGGSDTIGALNAKSFAAGLQV